MHGPPVPCRRGPQEIVRSRCAGDMDTPPRVDAMSTKPIPDAPVRAPAVKSVRARTFPARRARPGPDRGQSAVTTRPSVRRPNRTQGSVARARSASISAWVIIAMSKTSRLHSRQWRTASSPGISSQRALHGRVTGSPSTSERVSLRSTSSSTSRRRRVRVPRSTARATAASSANSSRRRRTRVSRWSR